MLHLAVMNSEISDSDKLRNRAIRLFAMVLNARERGFGSADHIADLAHEALTQADEIDRRGDASACPPDISECSVVSG
jgi:hypothetical protein